MFADPEEIEPEAVLRELKKAALRSPFPWFGGKSRVAHLVWERFGEVRNFVEPFLGSGAVLLARPGEPKIETVNDVDSYLANFWRAVAADPDEVARWADWPVNEADLHARHRWLVETARERVEQCKTDPDFFDAKVAGWWVWGQCLWIGSGWCQARELKIDGSPREKMPDMNAGQRGSISSGAEFGKLPAIAGRDGGRGAYAKSRSRDPEWEQRPHLGSDGMGQGITRESYGKRPHLSSKGGNNGVHKPSLAEKRPLLTGNNGGNVGVNATRLSNQVPSLRGDSGAAGQGIHASGLEAKYGKLPLLGGTSVGKGVHRGSRGLEAYMRALSDRLRRVRVCCGDFERILGPAVTTCIGTTGVFLDPPYDLDGRAICYSHDGEDGDHGKAVWWRAFEWAKANGNDPLLRIALCGYEHPDAIFPDGWEEIAWKASGGYGRSARGKANARRERIWFSPHCLKPVRLPLFDVSLPLTPVETGEGRT